MAAEVASARGQPSRTAGSAWLSMRVSLWIAAGGFDGYPVSAATRVGQQGRQGFNTTDIPMEFCLLNGEVAEAFDAWRKGSREVGEELADSAIYLLGLAEMVSVDLQNEIVAKIEKNAARIYRRLPSGVLVKTETMDSAEVQSPQ
jgi:NTP pyrophosphatase (non-canonical NTP hydrolase)